MQLKKMEPGGFSRNSFFSSLSPQDRRPCRPTAVASPCTLDAVAPWRLRTLPRNPLAHLLPLPPLLSLYSRSPPLSPPSSTVASPAAVVPPLEDPESRSKPTGSCSSFPSPSWSEDSTGGHRKSTPLPFFSDADTRKPSTPATPSGHHDLPVHVPELRVSSAIFLAFSLATFLSPSRRSCRRPPHLVAVPHATVPRPVRPGGRLARAAARPGLGLGRPRGRQPLAPTQPSFRPGVPRGPVASATIPA